MPEKKHRKTRKELKKLLNLYREYARLLEILLSKKRTPRIAA